jgi:hypothetical protein
MPLLLNLSSAGCYARRDPMLLQIGSHTFDGNSSIDTLFAFRQVPFLQSHDGHKRRLDIVSRLL